MKTIIKCPENRYGKDKFRVYARSYTVSTKSKRGEKHKLSLLHFALQEDSRLDGLSLSSSSLPTPKARNTKRQSERGTEFSSTDLRVYVNTNERIKMRFYVSISMRVYICSEKILSVQNVLSHVFQNSISSKDLT